MTKKTKRVSATRSKNKILTQKSAQQLPDHEVGTTAAGLEVPSDTGPTQSPAPAPAPPVVRVSMTNPPSETPSGLSRTQNEIPRSSWNNVKLEDIGKFEIIPSQKPAHLMLEEGHPFVEGDSKFIYYVMTPVFEQVARTTKVPINAKNKLTKRMREQFSSQLEAAMERLSSFWVQDILPQTMAVESALDKVEELVLQLTGDAANLPRDMVKRRYEQSLNIKVLRYVSQTMGLTKKEHRMLLEHTVMPAKPTPPPQPIILQTKGKA